MAERSSTAEKLEWVLGAVAAVAVLSIIGFLAWQGLGDSQTDPKLAVEPVDSAAEGQLRFAVRNDGGRTATGVVVSLMLRDGDRVVEDRQLTIDYLPGHSETMGAFVLTPGSGGLQQELSVDGYVDP
jgi:uncharacterized protein (TIGR02588 family)